MVISTVAAAVGAFFGPQTTGPDGNYFDAWWIALPLLISGIFNAGAFVFGIVSIVFLKERSLLVAFASFVGFIAIGLWLGEAF